MRNRDNLAALRRQFADLPRQRGVRNPFRTFANVRSEAWAKRSDFIGSVSSTRGIVAR